ncbi:MAG: UvrB/UvrC motif-containing protein [Clostridia bacterium]|nr:UvrB/UvrC motif-containing protein [Clostridia bacterium]MBR2927031.1 UvrB/UvrC motif-containing protein [Clostridia bacterium]
MLCEKCKKRTATVFYNENLNGKLRSFSLCGECAAKLQKRGDIQDITSMMDSFADPFSDLQEALFHGFFGIRAPKSQSAGKKCPACGTSYQEIAERARVGCPVCYKTFQDELSGLIQSVHGVGTHTGKIPSRHQAKQERKRLLQEKKKALVQAVDGENYERAAILRDEIRQLENEQEKEAN